MLLEGQENYFDNDLFDKISLSKKALWAGTNPPLSWFQCTNAILENEKDHRLPDSFHQSFDLVYLLEINLGEYKNWPLILDEALRLLTPGGLLFIRMTDTPFLSIFQLKNFLNSWGNFSVYFDTFFADGSRMLAFKNQKTEKRTCELKTFSFGVITNGKSPDKLKTFVDSVRNIVTDNCEQIEIIVCGPNTIEAEIKNHCSSIIFIEEPDTFKSIGWITKKKNMIVKASQNENLIIAHDRYMFPKDFLKNLKIFGRDWSVLVCKQELEDNTRIPDWVTIGTEWNWTTPGILEYGDWSHYNFVNGGIIIAKNDVLKKSPWNELLFWNQAEDVELTRTLKQNGFLPRLARNLLVLSSPIRKNFMELFEHLPFIKDKYVIPGSNHISSNHINHLIEINKQITFSQENQTALSYQGIYIEKSWFFKPDGVSLRPKTLGFLSFALKTKPPTDSKFLIKVSDAQQIDYVSINEIKTSVIFLTDDKIEVPILNAGLSFNNIIRIRVANKNQEITLKSIILLPPNSTKSLKEIVVSTIKKLNKSKRPLVIKAFATPMLVILIPLYFTFKYLYKHARNIKNKATIKLKAFESKYFNG